MKITNDQIKEILTAIFNYFKAVFFFWYPEAEEEYNEIVNEFEGV